MRILIPKVVVVVVSFIHYIDKHKSYRYVQFNSDMYKEQFSMIQSYFSDLEYVLYALFDILAGPSS